VNHKLWIFNWWLQMLSCWTPDSIYNISGHLMLFDQLEVADPVLNSCVATSKANFLVWSESLELQSVSCFGFFLQIRIDNVQRYKVAGKTINMVSLIKLQVYLLPALSIGVFIGTLVCVWLNFLWQNLIFLFKVAFFCQPEPPTW
jgi:hypothetical protein